MNNFNFLGKFVAFSSFFFFHFSHFFCLKFFLCSLTAIVQTSVVQLLNSIWLKFIWFDQIDLIWNGRNYSSSFYLIKLIQVDKIWSDLFEICLTRIDLVWFQIFYSKLFKIFSSDSFNRLMYLSNGHLFLFFVSEQKAKQIWVYNST